jgi:hypothetical protein
MKYRLSACHYTAKVIRNQIHFGMEHSSYENFPYSPVAVLGHYIVYKVCNN